MEVAERKEKSSMKIEWIELKERDFSRLLYTNPVVFLSTCGQEGQKNVMVLSWLTATNNKGGFVFSINKRRHTVSLLSKERNFVLSVPTAEMEEIVLEVGKTSGQFGSKFKSSSDEDQHTDLTVGKTERAEVSDERKFPLSKRQKKKLRRLNPEVDGLKAVSLYSSDEMRSSSYLFAIEGTVAYLQCKLHSMEETKIDDEHYLVSAEVTRASVNSSYWYPEKCIFRPQEGMPPYLTFFGSQTFGYVTS
mmetsp:Transcript_37716/g.43076  ORF Transcript_37716/g.43076 Transcript_37716/m.43076 type:complete len:248 (+) Transcript_37716:37-780(+)